IHRHVLALDKASFAQALPECRHAKGVRHCRTGPEVADNWHRASLRACRERPRGRRTAERSQQFPPSDGDCHTPLPREVRRNNDTTPSPCSLHIKEGSMLVASPMTAASHRLSRRAAEQRDELAPSYT